MPILLNCLEEPGTPANCCEQPYQFVTSDCVLKCLLAEALEVTRDVRTRYAGMLLSGTAGYIPAGQQVQDFQMLVRFLHDIFLEQVQTVNGGGTALTVQEQWDTYQLKCVADYFFCRYHYDIRPMLLHAGLYDPAYPPSIETLLKLPPYMEIPCGTPLPVPPPEPPADCVIPTWMEVADVVDSSFEVTADPSLAYLIKGNETNGTGGWHDHVGEVASSGGFNAPDLPYQVVSASDGAIWVVDGGGVYLLHPPVHGTFNSGTLSLSFDQAVPSLELLVEAEVSGVWSEVYSGPAADMPASVAIVGPVTSVRTTWYDGECVYGPLVSEVTAQAVVRSFEFSPTNPGGCLSLYDWKINGGEAVTPLLSGMTALTFAMWMKFTGTQDPFGEFVQICAFTETPDKIPLDIIIYFSAGSSTIYSAHPGWLSAIPPASVDVLADGNWHHFAYTYELGAPQKIYIDGVLADTMVNGPALEAGALAGYRIPNVYMANNLTMRYCEVYLCQSARSQADIANIIMAQDIIGNDAGWGRYLYMRPNDTDTGGQSTIDPNNPLMPMWSYRNLAITAPTFANDRP